MTNPTNQASGVTEPAAFDLIAHIHRAKAFSEKTFGPGARAQGVVAHIRKELLEIEAAPADLTEWVDVMILAMDGAWRAGHSPEAICAGIVAKQTKNEGRNWPDWRTASPDGPIEHVRSADDAAGPACKTCGDHGLVGGFVSDGDGGGGYDSEPCPDCSTERAVLATQPAAPAEVVATEDDPDAADEWRRLALQFDGHRMQALACIKAFLNAPDRHRAAAYEFLAAPPLSGEQVLADRIAALASPAQAPAAPSVGRPMPKEAHEGESGADIEFREGWNACLSALATPPAATAATEAPSDEQIRAAFTKDSGGPNPYYRCNECGATEPGLREYLAPHWLKHNATPAPAVGASVQPVLASLLPKGWAIGQCEPEEFTLANCDGDGALFSLNDPSVRVTVAAMFLRDLLALASSTPTKGGQAS